MIPLALLCDGDKAEIIDFIKKGKSLLCHLRDMGLFTGRVVEVVSNRGNGPILLKVNDSKVAIGRGMAMKIMVRRIE
ncbi:MAG: ferrous iron transport protein A [Thermodesulfovibrionales bacterium]|nr:ferrous iron transport protein A [Thermodesulfovibrionales bacterium]